MIVCADSLALPLRDGSIDCIISSPPYSLDMGYASDNQGYQAYLGWADQIVGELSRVSTPQGRVCWNVALDTNKGGKQALAADWLGLFKNHGWRYQTTIIWNEQNISRRTAWGSWLSASAPFVTAPVELILILHRGNWTRGKVGTSTIERADFLAWTLGLWTFPGASAKRAGHPAPFPEELVHRLTQLYTFQEDVILDPFAGSFTTVKVARAAGRRAIGIDLSDAYCRLGQTRCP